MIKTRPIDWLMIYVGEEETIGRKKRKTDNEDSLFFLHVALGGPEKQGCAVPNSTLSTRCLNMHISVLLSTPVLPCNLTTCVTHVKSLQPRDLTNGHVVWLSA